MGIIGLLNMYMGGAKLKEERVDTHGGENICAAHHEGSSRTSTSHGGGLGEAILKGQDDWRSGRRRGAFIPWWPVARMLYGVVRRVRGWRDGWMGIGGTAQGMLSWRDNGRKKKVEERIGKFSNRTLANEMMGLKIQVGLNVPQIQEKYCETM